MWIAYLDEAGTMGTLEARDSPIQPIFVLAAIFLHRKHLPPLTRDFLALKRRFFPNLFQGEDQYLDGILQRDQGAEKETASDPSHGNLLGMDGYPCLGDSVSLRFAAPDNLQSPSLRVRLVVGWFL